MIVEIRSCFGLFWEAFWELSLEILVGLFLIIGCDCLGRFGRHLLDYLSGHGEQYFGDMFGTVAGDMFGTSVETFVGLHCTILKLCIM